jgi:hypothetical protein
MVVAWKAACVCLALRIGAPGAAGYRPSSTIEIDGT